jgi:hypothetical protein
VMPRKECGYVYEMHEYRTDCGSKLILRPIGRCDKCGRKPIERKKDATSSNWPSDGHPR